MHIRTPLRIASVPSDHVYVRHLSPVRADPDVVRLPDPPVPGAAPGQWWPSPVLEPEWLRAQAGAFDVVHVHFGFEHRSTAQLRELVTTLRSLCVPLVLTVHDLSNPHLHDQRPHLEALDVLVPAAAEVITLTPGAARVIAQGWGRRASVLPHPHVVPLDRMGQERPPHADFVVGLHAKRRAGSDAEGVRGELESALSGLPHARLHPGHDRRLTDEQLWDHLAALDALVLPYRAGTHSGFLEACHDLGTPVIAPRSGFLAEQHDVLSYDLGVPGSLSAAVGRAFTERPGRRADRDQRARQRDDLARAHAQLYARAVAA